MKSTATILLMFFIATTFYTIKSNAQNSLKKEKSESIFENDKDISLEIKKGKVYLNGKKVAEANIEKDKDGKIIKQKVIVNGKELDIPTLEDFNFENLPFSDYFENNDIKPMLGVSSKPSKNNMGAEVESVITNSAAQQIGLQPGDIITKINDKNIFTPKDLVDEITTFQPGNEISVTYERNNKFYTKNVQLKEINDNRNYRGNMPFADNFFKNFNSNDNPFSNNPFKINPFNNTPKIGVKVEDRADSEGVLVLDVVENSAAAKAGIEKNDVITIYNSKEITNVDELMNAIAASHEKDKVFLDIKRNGVKRQISLLIPKKINSRDL